MRNIRNLTRSLESLRASLIKEVGIIDRTMEIIIKTNEKRTCPKCLSGDLRYMKDNEIFCRGCGYDSRTSQKQRGAK